MTGVLDRFFVALGFKVDPAGIAQLRGHVAAARTSILSLGGAIRGVIGGFAVAGIAKIGAEFESNRIAIAGFLSALGISSDFNAGLKDADAAMTSIIKAAARLPGEADEYIQVFKAGVPVLAKAMPGAGIQELSDFTNNFTALGKTLGVDAQQIGRDLRLMMSPVGRAGGHVRTFQEMIPFLQQLEGHADLTAASFNAMSQPARIKLLKDVLANPNIVKMIEAMSSSFDAMWGAAKSAFTMVTRLATKPLFEGIKEALDGFNAMFFDNKGKITAFGQSIVDIGKSFGKYVVQIGRAIAWIGKFEVALIIAKRAAIALVLWLLGPIALVAIGIALLIEDIYGFQHGMSSVTGDIVGWFKQIETVAAGVGGALIFLVGKLALAWAVASAKMAISWIVGMFPLFVTLVAVAALSAALYGLLKDWQVISTGMADLWDDFLDGFTLPDWVVDLGRFLKDVSLMGGSGGLFGNEYKPPERGTGPIPYVPSWGAGSRDRDERRRQRRGPRMGETAYDVPSASMNGADAGGPSWYPGPTSNTTTNYFNIKSTDPVAAGKEVERVAEKLRAGEYRSATRNAQSGTAG